MTLSWNSRTRFIEGAQFVDAAKLREGAPVSVIYHSPFFGKLFVTKVVLGGATAIRRTRSNSKEMRSHARTASSRADSEETRSFSEGMRSWKMGAKR